MERGNNGFCGLRGVFARVSIAVMNTTTKSELGRQGFIQLTFPGNSPLLFTVFPGEMHLDFQDSASAGLGGSLTSPD